MARRCRLVGWTPSVVAHESEREGWLERLNDLVAQEETRLRNGRTTAIKAATDEAFKSGPHSMVELDADKLLKLVPAPLQKAARELNTSRGGVLALGPTGVGKSAAMVFIGRRLITEAYDRLLGESLQRGERFWGMNVRGIFGWARAVDLATARRRHSLGSEAPELEAAKAPATLVLDDLGWEVRGDTAVAEVIAERYDRGLQTLVTSGLPWSSRQKDVPCLVERYGEALLRRVLESGGVKGRVVDLFPKTEAPCG
ncbi:MAG TPA: hypothetical protein VH062_13480 [Polyangiaceae bacterium]|nr:hypothetical protein [Polyangiaceae bacterium]